MRVAAKLISVLVLGVMLIVAIEAYVSITRDIAIFQAEQQRDTNQLSRTLKELVEDMWNHDGQQRALDLVEDANREELLVHVRVARLDAARDAPDAPRASAETIRMVREGKPISVEERDEAGDGVLFNYALLDVDSGPTVALEISRPMRASDQFRRATIRRACLTGITVTAASGVAVVVLGMAFIGRPLNRLVEKTRRVGTGDLTGPIILKRHDEMGELARALNEMCEHLAEVRANLLAETEARVQALQQLRHADRLTTVGRLAAGMAHELGTPLNVASARADMICEQTSRRDVADSARIVKAQVDRITKIVRQLLDFARQHDSHRAKQDLRELAVRTAEVVASIAKKQGIEICVAPSVDPLVMEVDAGQIQQVLTNLMVNAIQAMPKAGRVTVRLGRTKARPPGLQPPKDLTCARIEVHDEGCGISQDHLNQIFDPFFTTKEIGEGTGLGLSIAYGIVRDHGGWMEVESEPGKGTSFSVFLPEDDSR
jgi:signal transduction histidine kinase